MSRQKAGVVIIIAGVIMGIWEEAHDKYGPTSWATDRGMEIMSNLIRENSCESFLHVHRRERKKGRSSKVGETEILECGPDKFFMWSMSCDPACP